MENLTRWMEDYLSYGADGRKLDEKTLRAYRFDIEQFRDWLSGTKIRFDKEGVRSYVAFLNARYAERSTKRKIASIRAFFFYLQEYKNQPNPFAGMRICIREPRRLPRTIPLENLNKLLSYLYDYGHASCETPYAHFNIARDRVVFELLIATGMRVSELCSLDIGSLSPSNRTVRIMGKGSKERVIQIENEHTLAALNKYRKYVKELWPEWDKEDKNPLILNKLGGRISDQSIRNIINCWTKTAGLTGHITPHMFRHTFATMLLESDVDIRYIQRFLGHSSIKTTEIYTHVSSSKMRDILKTNNPRSSLNADS